MGQFACQYQAMTYDLQMQFFTWEAMHPQLSWWRHFEMEVPKLAAMGVTQVWLPPPNKAMRKVCIHFPLDGCRARVDMLPSQQGQGYDAYDLVSVYNSSPNQTVAQNCAQLAYSGTWASFTRRVPSRPVGAPKRSSHVPLRLLMRMESTCS